MRDQNYNSKILYEAMRKTKLSYNHSKNKHKVPNNFKGIEGNDFQIREFNPFNKHKSYQNNTLKGKKKSI